MLADPYWWEAKDCEIGLLDELSLFQRLSFCEERESTLPLGTLLGIFFPC